MMEYFYRIYGLRVQSQIPFSEAVPETAGEAEVKIGFGRMPDFLLEAGCNVFQGYLSFSVQAPPTPEFDPSGTATPAP